MRKIKKVVPQWEEERDSVIVEEQEVIIINNKEKMSKKLVIVLVVLVVVLLALAVWLGMMAIKKDGAGSPDPAAPSKYSVVEMANGTIYFGKLSWSRHPVLSGAWVLQRTLDEKQQQQVGVVPADRAFWKPVSDLYLNKDLMVSWTYLRNDSDMVKAMDNPAAFEQQQQQQGAASQQPAEPAPTEPKAGE